jgi:hypothetical protein
MASQDGPPPGPAQPAHRPALPRHHLCLSQARLPMPGLKIPIPHTWPHTFTRSPLAAVLLFGHAISMPGNLVSPMVGMRCPEVQVMA